MGRRDDDDDGSHHSEDEPRRDKKSKKEKKEDRHNKKKKSRDEREDEDVKKPRRHRDEEDSYDSDDRRRSRRGRRRYDDDDDDDEEGGRKKKSKRHRDEGQDDDDDDDDEEYRRKSRRHREDDDDDDHDDDRHHKKASSKRHRDDEEDDRRRERKSKDRHRRDDSPEERRHRHRDKDRKRKSSKQIATAAAGASLVSLGSKFGKPPPKLVDPANDYFEYHKHLWVYLFREEGKFFNDLTSEEAHEAFSRFAERFNEGDLEASYYCNNGLPQDAIDECKTTGHVWSFSTNDQERQRLQVLQEGVRKQTEYEATGAAAAGTAKGDDTANADDAPFPAVATAKGAAGATTRTKAGQPSTEGGTPSGRRLRDLIRTAEEELSGGRKEGRERQLEAKKELSAKIHGAARDKEEMVGAVELGDDALYGDSSGDFQTALARERQRAAQRQESKERRVAELQQKDQEKQKAMLEKLGLTGIQPGQKITIAPRKDPETK